MIQKAEVLMSWILLSWERKWDPLPSFKFQDVGEVQHRNLSLKCTKKPTFQAHQTIKECINTHIHTQNQVCCFAINPSVQKPGLFVFLSGRQHGLRSYVQDPELHRKILSFKNKSKNKKIKIEIRIAKGWRVNSNCFNYMLCHLAIPSIMVVKSRQQDTHNQKWVETINM